MSQAATLYRMQTDEHTCPFGLRAKDLLRRKGYQVNDKVLESREEANNLMSSLDVETTPQVVIDEKRIGGYEDLERYLGKTPNVDKETSYFPVASLFTISALLSLGLSTQLNTGFQIHATILLFIGLSMIMLGLLKLQNLEGFVNGFLGYDLLARRYVPYAFAYPFLEVLAGLLMISGLLGFVSIPLMLVLGGVGGVSVFKAVYIEKRELKCACVGGNSKVPLGFVSFLENAIMFGAAIIMMLT